ncbi:hypothetical protein CR513_51600, partial [Mucuna pruriens]
MGGCNNYNYFRLTKDNDKSAYSINIQYDMQVNNICETFNKVIIEYKDKPIIILFERLKFYITNRNARLRDLRLWFHGHICPRGGKKVPFRGFFV